MKRDISLYLNDIYNAIVQIELFRKDLSFNDFINDDKTSNAIIRKLEIIGEAVKHIPQNIRMNYDDIPWKEMAGMRDKLIHFYFGIDYDLVWKVIDQDLMEIKPKILKILKEMNGLLFQ
jgi:uncharacterized protein with HEPN domain